MHIKSFKYSQFAGQPNEWCLDRLSFRDTNLIVGKNAVGKSRALGVINNLAVMLSTGIKLKYSEGDAELCFDDGGTEIIYTLKYRDTKVYEETFSVDGIVKLRRGDAGEGKIFAEKLDMLIEFQTPEDELAAVSRRDSLQHSYLEPLYLWANSELFYHFGGPLGKESILVLAAPPPPPDVRNENNPVGLYYHAFGALGDRFDQAIREDMMFVGYDLESVGMRQLQSIKVVDPIAAMLYGMTVKERDIPVETEHQDISAGMFRALSLFVQLNYALMTRPPSCILVDDVGEGLDYERSLNLIKRLMTKASDAGVQLIMSTNDRFVMNSVPLENWTVLQRTGGHVRVFNYETSRNVFDDFKYSGLNNFDFFAYDYLSEEAPEEVVDVEASGIR